MEKKYKYWGIVVWLCSANNNNVYYVNPNNRYVNNNNDNANGVRALASINCGYIINDCIRDNIETNCDPVVLNYKIKIDKYTC